MGLYDLELSPQEWKRYNKLRENPSYLRKKRRKSVGVKEAAKLRQVLICDILRKNPQGLTTREIQALCEKNGHDVIIKTLADQLYRMKEEGLIFSRQLQQPYPLFFLEENREAS